MPFLVQDVLEVGKPRRIKLLREMLLESALADFNEGSTNGSGHPSAMPFVWDEKSGNPFNRNTSFHERIAKLSVQENEGLHLHEEAAEMFNARNNCKGAHNRSDSGQFYHKEGSVPFKWEAAPGKPVIAQETVNPESPRLRPPPALRNVAVSSFNSPRHAGITGKMKSILSGKVPPKNAISNGNASCLSSKSNSDREQWSSSSGREDTDRDSSVDSDAGEESSPVSTLDRPASPVSPTCSPKIHPPIHPDSAVSRQANGHGSSNLRNGTNARPQSQMAHCLLAMTEMSEELPIIEEDEEDSEFHTMEFPVVDSPRTIEERRERSLLRRPGSSKSLSAPLVRRQSSLGNNSASRQRRRSDFDWPEDFDERPEEVVKEVDESLWAFSPVASTFVFAGNEQNSAQGSRRSPGRDRPGTNLSTPSSSNSGSLRETMSLRKTLMRASSSKTSNVGKASGEAAGAHVEYSGQLGRPGCLKYPDEDDVTYSARGHRAKRSFSCIPFLNLCRTQNRPTPAISFSHRLSPNISNSRK